MLKQPKKNSLVVPIFCVVEFLVIIFGTIPDLEFITIGIGTIGTEVPLLVITTSAVGNLYRSTVHVICTETLFGVGAG